MNDKTGWMIEKLDGRFASGEWWCGIEEGYLKFTKDPNAAAVFPDKASADFVINGLDLVEPATEMIATEHVWCNAAPGKEK